MWSKETCAYIAYIGIWIFTFWKYEWLSLWWNIPLTFVFAYFMLSWHFKTVYGCGLIEWSRKYSKTEGEAANAVFKGFFKKEDKKDGA